MNIHDGLIERSTEIEWSASAVGMVGMVVETKQRWVARAHMCAVHAFFACLVRAWVRSVCP